ncbi:MAG: response regulator transcription factor [Acidimicrobiia bacterium]
MTIAPPAPMVPALPVGSTASLSPREREVLGCVAAGMPNRLIAHRLGIAERTVKVHLTRVFTVLEVRDRTQAALWARRHGVAADPA